MGLFTPFSVLGFIDERAFFIGEIF